jgi:hypothetical protein
VTAITDKNSAQATLFIYRSHFPFRTDQLGLHLYKKDRERKSGGIPMKPHSVLINGSKPAETLGSPLPAIHTSINFQGGPPNFADTYIAPFTVADNRAVFSWKAQLEGGRVGNGGCAIAVGIQLKVLRPVPNSTLVCVIAAGAVHNPLLALQARFRGDCPSFQTETNEAVVQFTESGLIFSPGDMVGLTIMSDPNSQQYAYPFAPAPGDTRCVLRNVAVGDSIDLSDIHTGTLPAQSPAILLSLGIEVAIDIQPGQQLNVVHLRSTDMVPVAIFSSPSFDVAAIDVASLRLAGAHVGTNGKGGKLLCRRLDVNRDGRPDLLCAFKAGQLSLSPEDTVAVLEGRTLSGVAIRGHDKIRVIP